MKRFFCLAFLVENFFNWHTQVYAADKKLVIVADEWCPFNCSKTSLDQGFMIDVTREILAAEGYLVEYSTLDWVTARSEVAMGRRDAIVGASRDEAIGLMLVEEPLGENKTCFYTRVDDPFIFNQTLDLAKRRIGIGAGYLYGDNLDQYIKKNRANFNLIQLATGERPVLQNIEKLKGKRIDTILENVQVMDFSLRKYRLTGVRLAGCEMSSPLFMAISPQREDAGKIASLMSRGIRKLRQSGRMREILARYGVTDWK